MKYKSSLWLGDTRFEDLPLEKRQEYRKKATQIYSDIVQRRVVEMIKEGKSKEEIMKYLRLN